MTQIVMTGSFNNSSLPCHEIIFASLISRFARTSDRIPIDHGAEARTTAAGVAS